MLLSQIQDIDGNKSQFINLLKYLEIFEKSQT